jgi:bifunctional DNA-binding transcriptional regulator/antitoxin component of YhaV-PrlF toxin-antitoxin module
MVIPRSLRQEAGVSEGTILKVDVVKDGQFLVTAQFTVDRTLAADPKNHKQLLRELAQTAAGIRQEAKQKGLDKMSKHEINAAVTAARRDLRKPGKRPAK